MTKSRIRSYCILCMAMFALFLSPVSTPAEDTKQKIEALEKRVQELEKRVAKLEALLTQKLGSNIRQVPNASGNWRDKKKWRSLKKGMTKQQVRQLLGEPPKINANSFGDFWYYPDALGGNVDFDKRDRVHGWTEP